MEGNGLTIRRAPGLSSDSCLGGTRRLGLEGWPDQQLANLTTYAKSNI